MVLGSGSPTCGQSASRDRNTLVLLLCYGLGFKGFGFRVEGLLLLRLSLLLELNRY